MDIKSLLTYLKEELSDIPAEPKNIHYTSLKSLYYILQSGIKGQLGGYKTRVNKTKKNDMELSTVRNSHKITVDEMMGLSDGAGSGGVEIQLFTDRILAAHRGTRKVPIAELPISQQKFLDRKKKEFKQRYGVEPPQLFKKENALKKFDDIIKEDGLNPALNDWVEKNIITANPRMKINARDDAFWYNKYSKDYYEVLLKREREERFILKTNIPVNPDFMKIIITADLGRLDYDEEEFLEEVAPDYLKLLKKHEDVFIQNKAHREFENFLRKNSPSILIKKRT